MILQADGGHYLTQSADVPIDERVFGNTAYISDSSEASKYRQVSEAEKERSRKGSDAKCRNDIGPVRLVG